jgi:hypothetical protein
MILSALGSVAAAMLAASSSVSGVYVGASADTVQMVQIVRTPDGRLAGRIEEVSLASDGAMKDDTIVLDGAADGDQITLSPKSILLSGNSASLTGFISGDLFDVSWLGGGHRTLKRADAYAFEAAVTGLKARSAMIIADQDAKAKAAEKAAAIRGLLQSTEKLSEQVGQLQRDLPGIQQRMAQTQSEYTRLQIESSHDRHRRDAFIKAGLGLIAMKQGTNAQGVDVQLQGLHGDTALFRSTVQTRIADAGRLVSNVELSCRSLMGTGESVVENACRDGQDLSSRLEQIGSQLDNAFAGAETIYQHPTAYVPIGRRLIQGLLQ